MWKRLAGRYGGGDDSSGGSDSANLGHFDGAYRHECAGKMDFTADDPGFIDQPLIDQNTVYAKHPENIPRTMSKPPSNFIPKVKPPPIQIPENTVPQLEISNFTIGRNRKFRPASSIYSQPSPPALYHLQPALNHTLPKPVTHTLGTELSSIGDSADFCAVKREENCHSAAYDSTGWSTIDEIPMSPDCPAPLNLSKKNDALRATTNRAKIAATAANLFKRKDVQETRKRDFSNNPRWDPLTGEPTKSSRGQPSQVKPGEFSPLSSTFTKRDAITVGQINRSLPEPTSERKEENPYNNISPLTMFYPPMPLNVSKQNHDRRGLSSGSSEFGSPNSGTVSPLSETSGVSTPVRTQARFTNNTSCDFYDEPRTPSSFSYGQPHVRSASTSFENGHEEYEYTHEREESSLDTVKPYYPGRQQPKFFTSTSQIERNFDLALDDIGKLAEQPTPDTRPHATVKNPVTIIESNPDTKQQRPSILNLYPKSNPNPVLERSRPRLNSDIDAHMPLSPSKQSIHRKPMSSEAVQRLSSLTSAYTPSVTPSIASNKSKSLPPAPPVLLTSEDLISNLEARLQDLARRRINLDKSIFHMTQLMPQAGVLGQERERRREEERKVKALEDDLLEVRKDEHELGLRLHRAWKREAKAARYEPQSLWVRRVTG